MTHPILNDNGVDVFNKVLDWLYAGGDGEDMNFDMNIWREGNSACGTVCCIGGAAIVYSKLFEPSKTLAHVDDEQEGLEEHVIHEELPEDEYDRACSTLNSLFFPDRGRYYNVTSNEAALVLEHFLETGEVDWTKSGLELTEEDYDYDY